MHCTPRSAWQNVTSTLRFVGFQVRQRYALTSGLEPDIPAVQNSGLCLSSPGLLDRTHARYLYVVFGVCCETMPPRRFHLLAFVSLDQMQLNRPTNLLPSNESSYEVMLGCVTPVPVTGVQRPVLAPSRSRLCTLAPSDITQGRLSLGSRPLTPIVAILKLGTCGLPFEGFHISLTGLCRYPSSRFLSVFEEQGPAATRPKPPSKLLRNPAHTPPPTREGRTPFRWLVHYIHLRNDGLVRTLKPIGLPSSHLIDLPTYRSRLRVITVLLFITSQSRVPHKLPRLRIWR